MPLTKQDAVNQMMGFFQAKALTAALALKLFDQLRDRDADAAHIAARLDCPARSTEQLLIALRVWGISTNETAFIICPPPTGLFC